MLVGYRSFHLCKGMHAQDVRHRLRARFPLRLIIISVLANDCSSTWGMRSYTDFCVFSPVHQLAESVAAFNMLRPSLFYRAEGCSTWGTTTMETLQQESTSIIPHTLSVFSLNIGTTAIHTDSSQTHSTKFWRDSLEEVTTSQISKLIAVKEKRS